MSALDPVPLAEAVGTLNAALSNLNVGDYDDLIEAMALVYAMLAARPGPEIQVYNDLSEATLAALAAARAATLPETGLVVANTTSASIRDASVLLRAIEASCLEGDRQADNDLELAWVTRDGRHYVARGLPEIRATDNRPFRRRALLHHRVLPTTVAGLRVRLYRLPELLDADGRAAASERYGAGFFPGLTLEVSPGTDPFVALEASGFDAPAVIERQLDAARESSCRAIVWPELTVTEASLAHLKARLADRAIDGAPDFVVAGSWHRELVGGRFNVGDVLTGGGETLFQVVKWAPYWEAGRREAIEIGTEIPVLVIEGQLVAFAICRDFLADDAHESPYCQLPVDLVIVPSMGVETTVVGHAITAKTMRTRFDARTFAVVQPKAPATPVGFVLAMPADPTSALHGVPVEGEWHLCER